VGHYYKPLPLLRVQVGIKPRDAFLLFSNNFSVIPLVYLAISYVLCFFFGAIEFCIAGSYNPRVNLVYSQYPITLCLFTGIIRGVGCIYDENNKTRNKRK